MPEITGGQSTLLGGRACPEVAFFNGTAEKTLYTLAYGNFAGLFVEAIKELKGELDALKKKVGI